MSSCVALDTKDNLEYTFYPNTTGLFHFQVKAKNDARIALCSEAKEANPMYEILIGGWENTKSVIRKNRAKPDVAEAPTPGILSGDEFRGFWIRWENGTISAGRKGEESPFVKFSDKVNVPIKYVGIGTGWGATGSWVVNTASEEFCWVHATKGQIPDTAFQGGEDRGNKVYICRAHLHGGLYPGKLVGGAGGTAFIGFGGIEYEIADYEVLCNFPQGRWVSSSGANIPPGAVLAGKAADGGPLYIGRKLYDRATTVGKVDPRLNALLIPYAGKELSFKDYEILVE